MGQQPIDLGRLLADPARVAAVRAEEVPAVLTTIAAEQSRLAALQGALAARMTVPATNGGEGDRLLTLQEAARFLGKSPAWLRRKAAGGAFPCARRIGRSWRFPATDLERYVGRMRQVG